MIECKLAQLYDVIQEIRGPCFAEQTLKTGNQPGALAQSEERLAATCFFTAFQQLQCLGSMNQMGPVRFLSKRAVAAAVPAEVRYWNKNISRIGDGIHLAAELHQLQDISARTILRSFAHNFHNSASFAIFQS